MKIHGSTSFARLVKDYVGREVELSLEAGSISIRATILDVRRVYGRVEFLCEPVFGYGQIWVRPNRLELVVEA